MRRLKILLKNLFSIPYRICFTKISPTVIMQGSKVDKHAAICGRTKFYRSNMGKYSYIGANCFVESTTIGKFTSIASNCYIGSASHPTDWVSTSSVFHKQSNILRKHFAMLEYEPSKETHIGNDVWIGEGCKIKAGVTIGDGAVIGMGSIVTKDVEPYAIYAGNPARCIRKRFDEETVQQFLEMQWWNWSEKQIKEYSSNFNHPESLLKKLENEK